VELGAVDADVEADRPDPFDVPEPAATLESSVQPVNAPTPTDTAPAPNMASTPRRPGSDRHAFIGPVKTM